MRRYAFVILKELPLSGIFKHLLHFQLFGFIHFMRFVHVYQRRLQVIVLYHAWAILHVHVVFFPLRAEGIQLIQNHRAQLWEVHATAWAWSYVCRTLPTAGFLEFHLAWALMLQFGVLTGGQDHAARYFLGSLKCVLFCMFRLFDVMRIIELLEFVAQIVCVFVDYICFFRRNVVIWVAGIWTYFLIGE